MNKPHTNANRSENANSRNHSDRPRRPHGGANGNRNFKSDKSERGGERKPHEGFERRAKTDGSNTQKPIKKDFIKYDTSLIKLNGNRTLCSFYVEHDHNLDRTIEILKIILVEAIDQLVVSIPSEFCSNNNTQSSSTPKTFEETVAEFESVFGDYKDIIRYVSHTKCTKELKVHNETFKTHESDIFFVTNSSMEPREYAIEILRKYLSREYSVAVVPTVYNAELEIQKYCLRFPSLLAKLKCLLGCKKTEEKLVMMERGDVGYYKIHRTDVSLSQTLVINSVIFSKVGMFSTCRDTTHSLLAFYKKLKKHGTVLFVPTARFIEHKKRQNKCCFFSKACYFLKNVF